MPINIKKKLAIIGASYLQMPLIQKAKELNIESHVFAWECNDVGEREADFFYPISITEKEKILDVCVKLKIDGIISIASDLAMLTVNYIANKMQLIGNEIESVVKSSDKGKMREAFLKNNDPSPLFGCYSNYNDINIDSFTYPLIVKPSDRSGSRGITKIGSKSELRSAFTRALDQSFSKKVVIEQFIGGVEYSIECISIDGIHTYLAATKKYTTGSPNFIETGHMEPSGLNLDTIEQVKKIIYHALDTLQIRNGASHSEITITETGEIYIIEIGARMGGDLIGSHLVYYSTGYDYVEMVINVALGLPVEFKKKHDGFPVEVVYLFNEEDMKKLQYLEVNKKDALLYISDLDISKLGCTTDSSNRLGCYLMKVEE